MNTLVTLTVLGDDEPCLRFVTVDTSDHVNQALAILGKADAGSVGFELAKEEGTIRITQQVYNQCITVIKDIDDETV